MAEKHLKFVQELAKHLLRIRRLNVVGALRKQSRCVTLFVVLLGGDEGINSLHPLQLGLGLIPQFPLSVLVGALLVVHLISQVFPEGEQVSLQRFNLLHELTVLFLFLFEVVLVLGGQGARLAHIGIELWDPHVGIFLCIILVIEVLANLFKRADFLCIEV